MKARSILNKVIPHVSNAMSAPCMHSSTLVVLASTKGDSANSSFVSNLTNRHDGCVNGSCPSRTSGSLAMTSSTWDSPRRSC
eukprot:55457-Eustigmatos_ZCMA.PRE.1